MSKHVYIRLAAGALVGDLLAFLKEHEAQGYKVAGVKTFDLGNQLGVMLERQDEAVS